MTSNNAVRVWLPEATAPVVAGKLEADDQSHVQFI